MNEPDAQRLLCPHCQRALRRVHRTVGDRLLGLFRPRGRFRCTGAGCGWEGLLPLRQRPLANHPLQRPLDVARSAPARKR